jgi:uncharacterized membrane protein HdeD (DUF308 family)
MFLGYHTDLYDILFVGVIIAFYGIYKFYKARDGKQYRAGWIYFFTGIILMVIDIIGRLIFNLD